MQFTQIIAIASAVSVVAALPQFGEASSSQGACSTGTAQCCATVQSEAESQSLIALLGLNSIAGDIGLNCQQVPINAIGAAVAVQNQCKNTAGEYLKRMEKVPVTVENFLIDNRYPLF